MTNRIESFTATLCARMDINTSRTGERRPCLQLPKRNASITGQHRQSNARAVASEAWDNRCNKAARLGSVDQFCNSLKMSKLTSSTELARRKLEAFAMYPTKSQRIRATFRTRGPSLTYAALIGATLTFAVISSMRAGELEAKGAEKISFLPETPPITLQGDAPLLAQAETATSAKKKAKHPVLNLDEKGVILKGYDPVAYFKQGKAVKGDPKYSSKFEGAIYYFASADDKDEFDKSPAKYKPQYGGYCANGMMKGKLHPIDPTAFYIYKGKLYVCTGTSQLNEFKAKPDVNVKKADKQWEYYQPPEIPGFLGGSIHLNPPVVI
jgi:YHS domain-containing protein